MVERTRSGGAWTEARFKSFIRGALRSASRRWGPINEVRKSARVERGKYKCNGCKKAVPFSNKVNGKRQPNTFVDHINPVIDPKVGFTTWDDFIERLFCEAENLQLLCKTCHDKKSKEERKK